MADRAELKAQAGQANITQQEALKRHGLNSGEYRAALAEYVRLSAALTAAPNTAAVSAPHTAPYRSPAGCAGYRRGEGCPMHGETCAPEYR
ncbi:MAG: hypothetical protein WC211_12425 [Dehalococcoidia bacterium]